MVPEWLDALIATLAREEPAVLVSVARTEGSAPREAGTSMLVTPAGLSNTIGGGHLEWQAVQLARGMLTAPSSPPQPRIERFNLGARLGQCCGGVVWLLFEHISSGALPQWQERREVLAHGGRLFRYLRNDSATSEWSGSAQGRYGTSLTGEAGSWEFCQETEGENFPLYIFGAGHVARALVRQMHLLHADITLIDSRDDAFDEVDTRPLTTILTDTPEAEVTAAPPGTYFIVMTHSHAQDFSICEQIYKRRDFAFFGLIGSASKRASFEHRLIDRGLPRERLEEMTCPIGIPGIAGKEPEVIALAVAAQLLQIHSARRQAIRPRASAPLPQAQRS
jgi:xanthine dehydrogenase accessory factor